MKDDAPRVIKIPAKPETTRQAEARRQLRVAAYHLRRLCAQQSDGGAALQIAGQPHGTQRLCQ